ncbi:unnamed protein product [Gadus morhua 'NCC']
MWFHLEQKADVELGRSEALDWFVSRSSVSRDNSRTRATTPCLAPASRAYRLPRSLLVLFAPFYAATCRPIRRLSLSVERPR